MVGEFGDFAKAITIRIIGVPIAVHSKKGNAGGKIFTYDRGVEVKASVCGFSIDECQVAVHFPAVVDGFFSNDIYGSCNRIRAKKRRAATAHNFYTIYDAHRNLL